MKIAEHTGAFAGDKDAAASIRDEYIKPTLENGKDILLDFEGVDLATQSFIHALIAAVVREKSENLDHISFKNCNENVQSLIEIVVEYAQDEFE
ncbi:STAS-like domain-containing protein [Pseudarthrobacter sp. PS3-L1]|uniref:STAS-like domain-containing protein n=1 Tax=Pseudarthrobacter sp. PS3-L1 TaxID=3046207 RepID=UPI0024B8D384|nr:STAS-like domain-containing protein [Pseudarthrobacter sp. PS3-L1]MDJ0321973.1 STAS-like domain-containing protein [Pseudarthrobacter sp. PS3-L1]